MTDDARPRLLRRVAPTAAGLTAAAILGALFVRDVSVTDLERTLSRVSPGWLGAALAAMAANVLLGAVRWTWLVRTTGHCIPLIRGMPPAVVARAANDLLPLRGGDLLRAVAARRAFGVPLGLSAAVFAVERLLDGLSLGGVVVVAALAGGASDRWLVTGAALLAGSAVGLVAAAVAARRRPPAWFARPVRLLPARLRAPAAAFARDTVRGALALRSPSGVGVALALSVAMWALEWVMFLTAGRSVGLDLPAARFGLVQAAANLSLAVPTSPGGAGTFEYIAATAARSVHANPALVAGYVLVAHAVLILPSVVLALPLVLPVVRPGRSHGSPADIGG